MKDIPPPFRRGDFFFLGAMIGLAVFTWWCFLVADPGRATGPMILVHSNGRFGNRLFTFTTPGHEKRIRVEGPLGSSTLLIGADFVRFLSSPCPHKDCVRYGRLHRPGETAACVPNGILVQIVSGKENPLDGITR